MRIIEEEYFSDGSLIYQVMVLDNGLFCCKNYYNKDNLICTRYAYSYEGLLKGGCYYRHHLNNKVLKSVYFL